MRLRYTGEKFLQALAKQGSVEAASTYNLESGGDGILDKTMKAKFSTITHCLEILLDYIHVSNWGSAKIASLGGHPYFVLLIIYLGDVGFTLCDKDLKS